MTRLTVYVNRKDILPEHLHLQTARPDIDVVIQDNVTQSWVDYTPERFKNEVQAFSLGGMNSLVTSGNPKLTMIKMVRHLGGGRISLSEAKNWVENNFGTAWVTK